MAGSGDFRAVEDHKVSHPLVSHKWGHLYFFVTLH